MFVIVVELPSDHGDSEDVFTKIHIAGPFETSTEASDCLRQAGYVEEDVGDREIVYPDWHNREFRAIIRRI